MWGSSGDTTTWSLQGFRLDTNRHGVSTCCVPAAQCRRLCPHTDPPRLPWKIHFKGFKGALNCSPVFRVGMTPRDGSETDDHDVLPYQSLGHSHFAETASCVATTHHELGWDCRNTGKQYMISLGGNAQVTIFIL